MSLAQLRELRRALLADAQEEIDLALKVAVFLEAGVPHWQIAERLKVSRGAVKAAIELLRAITPRLEREERA